MSLGFLLAFPEVIGKTPILKIPVILSFCVSLATIIGVLFSRSETNFQNFQGQFIKLLDLHRNNIDSIDLKNLQNRDYPILNNHYFFQIVLDEFEAVNNYIAPKLKERKIQDIILYQALNRETTAATKAHLYLEELTALNISYLIVFFGMTKGQNSLKHALSKTYTQSVIDDIFEWMELFKQLDKRKNPIPLNGFQGVLGHYFRHLFSMVKYIHEPKFVISADKKNLCKILRAQLSTFEQSLLLINSLSILGRVWEIESEAPNENLITNYNLVRNIPAEFFDGLDPKQIYPNVDYE